MAKVLIGDDMVTVQHNLSTILESLGYEVVGLAKNCVDVINLYKEKKPDIVIIDILGMKAYFDELNREIDTFDTIEYLYKYDKNVKIVVLTATPKEEYIKKALLLGAKSFLAKGVSNEKIDATLKSLLSK